MTKIELIKLLESFNDDTEVKFSYDYGDYWHTQVVADINNVDLVQYSSYHAMDKVVDDNEDNEGVEVILLS